MWGRLLGVALLSVAAAASAAPPLAPDAVDGGTPEADSRPVFHAATRAPDGGTSQLHEVVAGQVLDPAAIARRPVATTAQLLDEVPGVFLQRPHSAGAAVNLRGFSGVDVGLTLNGVRLNSAGAHGRTPLSALDPFWVQRISVRRGLSPVLFGSDALGGVVEVETVRPQFAPSGTLGRSAQMTLITGTSAPGARAHLRAGVSLEHTAALVGVTGFSLSDLSGGARIGSQPYTANEGYGLGVALRHQLTPRLGLELRYLGSREDVALPTYSTPGDVRRLVDHERHVVHARGELTRLGPFSAGLDLSVHRQRATEARLDLAEDLHSNELPGEWSFASRLELRASPSLPGLGALLTRAGLVASYEVLSSRYIAGPLSSAALLQHRPGEDRYPGWADQLNTALFAHASTTGTGPWRLSGGVRADLRRQSLPEDARLATRFPGEPVQPASLYRSFGVSGELGVERQLLPGLWLLLRGAWAHRPPNLDEQLRLGSQGWGYLLPTRTLRDSSAYSGEVGAKVRRGPLQAELFYAYTGVNNPVLLSPVSLAGETGTGGEPFLQYRQADLTRLHSVEGSLHLDLPLDLTLAANATYLHGEVFSGAHPEQPLSRVPPVNGSWKLAYAPVGGWFGELAFRWGLAQPRLAEVDRLDPAICLPGQPCRPTDGFSSLHLRAGWRASRQLALTGELANLTHATYRYLGSALDEPGFSARLALEGSL